MFYKEQNILVGNLKGEIKCYNVNSGEEISTKNHKGLPPIIKGLSFQNIWFIYAANQQIAAINQQSYKIEVNTILHKNQIRNIIFCNEESNLISYEERVVNLYEMTKFDLIGQVKLQEPIKQLIAISQNRILQLCDNLQTIVVISSQPDSFGKILVKKQIDVKTQQVFYDQYSTFLYCIQKDSQNVNICRIDQ